MKVKKAITCVMAAAMLTTTFGGNTTFADMIITKDSDFIIEEGKFDFASGTASITIQGNQGQSMVGKRFEVFQLFTAQNAKQGESINYKMNPKFAPALKNVVAAAINKRDNSSLSPASIKEYMVIDYIQSLNNNQNNSIFVQQSLEGRYSSFRYFVEDVRTEIKKQELSGDILYVNNGGEDNSIALTGLAYGYYLVDEVSQHDENDEKWFASSLCMMSTANPISNIKIKSDYPQIIKKIQEDDNKEAIGNDGWNDVADYEIGQTVPYKYESTIPDMNGYETYYYAWHDQMDEELTFHNDKQAIGIVIHQGDKYYTVKDSEFNVLTSGDQLDAEDTFKIEITDIKKIIDREFDNMDTIGHNDYSQMTVTLEYAATLNDKAADKTGRPGFENDVRLEFSNNPDSNGAGETGYTPWDTVVCFTFKINGLKTNDHDLNLEGARFRLYSDMDCKNEVYIKAKPNAKTGTNDYVVINRDSTGGTDHTGGQAPKDAAEMVSDKEGNFTIFGLDQGVYYLKETKAPDGYRLLKDPIVITIEPVYTSDRNDYIEGEGATEKTLTELKATAHIKEFYDGQFKEKDTDLHTDVSDGSADIKIINQVGSRLPVTGSSGMILMLGAGIILTGGSIVAAKKRKAARDV